MKGFEFTFTRSLGFLFLGLLALAFFWGMEGTVGKSLSWVLGLMAIVCIIDQENTRGGGVAMTWLLAPATYLCFKWGGLIGYSLAGILGFFTLGALAMIFSTPEPLDTHGKAESNDTDGKRSPAKRKGHAAEGSRDLKRAAAPSGKSAGFSENNPEAAGRLWKKSDSFLELLPGHARRTLALRCGVVIPEGWGITFKYEGVGTLERKAPDGTSSTLHLIKLPKINKNRTFLVALTPDEKGIATFFSGTSIEEVDDYFSKYQAPDTLIKDDMTLELKDLRQLWFDRIKQVHQNPAR